MPRHAHGRPILSTGPSRPAKRKPRRNAALNALETAERQNPDSIKIRQHRLGESEDDSDGPVTRADTDQRSSKRRKITNEQDEQEVVDEGSDLEGGTWHTGVNEDDEDSDLDSDEAFGESDEEKFADFTFRGSDNKKASAARTTERRIRQIDLDEGPGEGQDNETVDDSASDDLGEEAVDLAAAWDMDDAEQNGQGNRLKQKTTKTRPNKANSLSVSESSDHSSEELEVENEGSDDEGSQFSFSENEAQGDTAGLRSFVEGLSASREGKIQPQSHALSSSKLSAADLLQYIKDPVQRQSLKVLQSAERSGVEEYRGGIPGKLSAPLAKRQQDRLDRSAAYEKSKETLNRWIDTVKQNRRSEHLSFPLADHAKDSAPGQKQLVPTSESAAATDLEATINQIMQESGMSQAKGRSAEDHEQAFEGLAEKKMDIEEVKARRAELRKARELMFWEEIRAKRIKKNKSKAFRRVHRRQRDRIEAQQKEALEAAGLLNSDEEREEKDRRRAEERMGARHRESKWARGVKQAGRAMWDDDARAGVTDLAKRDEDLRRRVMGKNATNSDASDTESHSDSDYDADSDAEHQKLVGKLDALDTVQPSDSQSRLGQMAFMQRAEAARKAENDEEIRQIRLALEDKVEGSAASEAEDNQPKGRQKFGVQSRAPIVSRQRKQRSEFEAPLSDSEDERAVAVNEPAKSKAAKAVSTAHTESYPQRSESISYKSETAKTMTLANGSGTSRVQKQSNQRSRSNITALDEYTSPSESEGNEANAEDAKAALAASIFAGPDDAVQEFAKEKNETVEEEGDQVIDNTLPGWGSWAGAGVSKKEQKKGKGRFVTTIKGVAADKRQDAKLDRVIVNEKRIKKNGKYLATELPHPFETRQQYERSLRLPIGPEWSTVNRFQDATKPRILLQQGTVIKPIAKPIA